jgi:hypothetical protein
MRATQKNSLVLSKSYELNLERNMVFKKILINGLIIITAICSTAYGKVNHEHAEKIVGNYLPSIVSTRELSVYLDNNQLVMESKGQGKFRLIHDEKNSFHLEGIPIKIKFISNDKSEFDAFIFTKRGKDRKFTRKETLISEYEKVATKLRSNGLTDAILLNDMDSAKALINAGIDLVELDTRPHLAGPSGRRPLNWAALENNTAMINLLLDAGVDINMTNLSGFAPLHHAAEAQAIESIQLLLEQGANVNLKTKNGRTALEIAAIRDNQPIIKLLQNAMQLDNQ